jgi:serine/threonine protein kinase
VTPTEDDPRLVVAAQEYLAELEARRRPDRQAFLDRHPELAEALGPYLDALDMVHAAAPLLGDSAGGRAAAGETIPIEPLGDFRIVREIGRGGMGVVYEAVQLSLGRRVALKVLPFAAALNAKQLQRFRTEAHAAAQLHHTNIVPVYAVGCERGVHFYAMQLIEGRPLDQVIREAGGPVVGQTTIDLQAGPTAPNTGATGNTTRTGRGREAYRTAARIAAQVADALEYAHDAGVVHRDVKPANLLLDAKGNVWVTDFGLAQVTADAGLTQTGDIFGTLRYMSPEQAAGRRVDVDHRTDIYSLGATLYELLTLVPAIPGQDRQAVLHHILRDDPRPPRQIDRAVPAELETIALKALAKAPADRYATAGEMAADLRRFLDNRPILARRPTLLDRGRKWVRRHPAYVGAAVLLLVLGVIGLAVTAAMVAREQARTRAALDGERARAAEAERQFQLARRAVDEMIRIGNEELADGPHELARKRLLEAALAYYQEFIEERRDDPTARGELAATHDRVKKLLDELAVVQGDRNLFFLSVPAVLDDLKLAGDDRDRVTGLAKGLADRRFESFREFHRLSPEERTRRFLEQARTNEAEVARVLTPDQLRRFRQITLQMQGPMAFRDPAVTAALKLTPAQREKIRTVESDVYFVFADGPRKGTMRLQAPLTAGTEKITALLTPDQQAKWKEMTGEPFAGPRFPFFGPPPFGPKDGGRHSLPPPGPPRGKPPGE